MVNEVSEIKVANLSGTAGQHFVFPFSNTPAGTGYTWVTEIFIVDFAFNSEGDTACSLYRGGEEFTNNNAALLVTLTNNNVGAYNQQVQYFYHDGNGNGLICPENCLYVGLANSSDSFQINIYYKMRKLKNKDLFIYQVNLGSSVNEA